MKELVNLTGGNLVLNEEKRRLILNLTTADSSTFKDLINHTAEAIKKYTVDDLLVDASRREGASIEDMDIVVREFKAIAEKELYCTAVVLPLKSQETDIAKTIISELESDKVRGFKNRQAAIEWMDDQSDQRQLAA